MGLLWRNYSTKADYIHFFTLDIIESIPVYEVDTAKKSKRVRNAGIGWNLVE